MLENVTQQEDVTNILEGKTQETDVATKDDFAKMQDQLKHIQEENQRLSQIVQGVQVLAQQDPVIRKRLHEIYYGQADTGQEEPEAKTEDQGQTELTQEELAEKVISLEKKFGQVAGRMAEIDYKEAIEDLARQDPDFFNSKEALEVMEQVVRENPQLEGMKNGAQLAYAEARRRLGDRMNEIRNKAAQERVAMKASGPSIMNSARGAASRPVIPTKNASIRRQLAEMVAQHNRLGI